MNFQCFDHQRFSIYACLPFVELAQESSIQIGPVVFWPASKASDFLNHDDLSHFEVYLQTIGQIKTKTQDVFKPFIPTFKLNLKSITCISISNKISLDSRELILIDALYLLYFACTFRSLYYGHMIPSFNTFRKLIPASSNFIHNKQNWIGVCIEEMHREDTICLHMIDDEICNGLGKALEFIYRSEDSEEKDLLSSYKRLVRSIRYLVDRFFQRFINLFKQGLNFREELFEPEDIIFLASSFETLFNIHTQYPAADFKHKLRPLLHLKYSRPVEIFWKWSDDFYEVKRRIIHGEPFLDPLFRLNPNFQVSHIVLGIKLFVYSVYYQMYKVDLMHTTHLDAFTPPDFKWIHPEEILLFFWTEVALLKKLRLLFEHAERNRAGENVADLHFLTHLFVSLYERYYLNPSQENVGTIRFIPTPLEKLQEDGNFIIKKMKQEEIQMNQNLLQEIHPQFLQALENRLQDKKEKLTKE